MVVKRAILASCRLMAKVYFDCFCSWRESVQKHRLLINKLKELQDYYIEAKQINSFEFLKNDAFEHFFMFKTRHPKLCTHSSKC